ncbi:MTHFR-domain-containing protein [Linderina pennispora]|uniref:MTHFR-domain-containing protein n=1 Tax=Linderina pennispora TaxID=61395 RepID=A0A1Y1WL31_9FUNG|nr:MTHFR-domain-containing protein [Linderina pennispora]ORX74075.1 MTHFR-domain-containing protein [Linderina pennispora]
MAVAGREVVGWVLRIGGISALVAATTTLFLYDRQRVRQSAKRLPRHRSAGTPFFSFEYFPPKTEQGLVNLYDRIERMSKLGPLFVAVTWGAGGGHGGSARWSCAGHAKGVFGIETVMHLTCTNMDKAKLDSALESAKAANVQNILALRGDTPRGSEYWTACDGGFSHAADLVRYVRQKYGDYFCIGVAGYPEGHIENPDKDRDFEFLVEKVQAGADFIVSQLVYDPETFIKWEQKCRSAGIAVPILPGSFRRLLHLTKVSVPEPLGTSLEEVRANDQAVKELGVEHAASTIRALQKAGVWGVHVTTLNLESSVQRPRLWDDFPNGRWGDARSPAFGNLSTYGEMLKFDPRGAAHIWGRPQSLDEISQLFERYVTGQITSLPWNDEPLRAESDRIRDELARINRLGYWTLASQPALDGVSSADELHGWGPRGGYVYQKAFIECFVPGDRFPGRTPRVTYYASNMRGDFLTNAYGEAATALTWGVFPGRAVVQPTLIEKISFLAWRAEAFQTWREWMQGCEFLEKVAHECWLVNVVDNEYKSPDAIWDLFI